MNNQIIRKSLSEVVAEHLQQQIQSEEYKLDQQLPTEPELMKQFGVGRSSIREAIRMLENTGLLRVQQGVGTFVASKQAMAEPLSKRLQSAKETDIREVRDLLETKIVEKAALNRTSKDITNIKASLAKRNKAADQKDLMAWLEADIQFHLSIAEACKNPILNELYKTFAEQELKRSIAADYSQIPSLHRLTSFHEDLLKGIELKDTKMAIAAILAMRTA